MQGREPWTSFHQMVGGDTDHGQKKVAFRFRWFAGTRTMDKLVLEIYDVFGRMVLAVNPSPSGRLGGVKIDVSELQSGTYLLKVFEDGNLKSVNRFVKLAE